MFSEFVCENGFVNEYEMCARKKNVVTELETKYPATSSSVGHRHSCMQTSHG